MIGTWPTQKALMRRVAGRSVDVRIWVPALALAQAGTSGQAIELQFVQRETQAIEADLGRWYREHQGLRDAAHQSDEATQVSLRSRVDQQQIENDSLESTRRAEGADPSTPEGRFVIEQRERQRVARRDGQRNVRVADDTLARRREAQRTIEASIVDQLHLAALERRRVLDEFVDVLNSLLRYYGHQPVEVLPTDLTDELVRRAVRPVNLGEA